MYLPEYVGWLSTNCGQGKKVSQLWMPFWSFGVSMKTKHNFIICGFNIRIFDLFKINSSCLCVLYLISLMAQAYVTVVVIFNSLPHCKHKLETWLNYYFKVILNVGSILVGAHGVLLVCRHKIWEKLCLIKIWIQPCEEHKERMRQGTVVLIMNYGIWAL